MRTLTSKQLLRATGIKSVRTLQRWRALNLVPPPRLQCHPSGRGMTLMWHHWAVAYVEKIKKRLAAGETLEDIAQDAPDDWEAEEKKWIRTRRDIKADFARMDRAAAIDQFAEWAADTTYDFLQRIGVERPGRVDDKISTAVSKPEFIDGVLALLKQGATPVMVVTMDDVTVSADFLLGAAICNSEAGIQPVLVVPIRDAFLEAFERAEPNLPKAPLLVPGLHVAESTEKETRVRKFRLLKNWKFSLEK